MSGEGKVIRPPIEQIASGKVFKPSKAFRNKMWFTATFTVVSIWLIVFGTFWLVLWLVNAGTIFTDIWWILNYRGTHG